MHWPDSSAAPARRKGRSPGPDPRWPGAGPPACGHCFCATGGALCLLEVAAAGGRQKVRSCPPGFAADRRGWQCHTEGVGLRSD